MLAAVLAALSAAPASAQEPGSALDPPSKGSSEGTPEGGEAPADESIPPPPGDGAQGPSGYEGLPSGVPEPPDGESRRGEGYPRGPSAQTDEGVRIPSRIATRIRVLDADLQVLASRGGNRIVDGVLSLLSGALSLTIGILIDDDRLSTYLYLWGSANIARGIIDLVLSPDPSDAAIAYGHMPMGTMDEVRERLQYGEDELEFLARRSRLVRILDASINIAAGVAVVPIYLAPNDFEIDDPLDYFVIIGSGISVISGIINLVTRTEAEKRWSAYESLRERLAREDGERTSERETGPRASFDLTPLRGGAAGLVTTTF